MSVFIGSLTAPQERAGSGVKFPVSGAEKRVRMFAGEEILREGNRLAGTASEGHDLPG